jgi:hypothetical protein
MYKYNNQHKLYIAFCLTKEREVYCFTLVCLSVCLSITNFCHSFLSNYSSQLLEILTHSTFWQPIFN